MRRLGLWFFLSLTCAFAQVSPIFPARAATDADMFVMSDTCRSNLALRIGATDTQIRLNDASGCPSANFLIKIEDELIAISSVSGVTLNVQTSGRGFNGTTAAGHAPGLVVQGSYYAYHRNRDAAEIEAIEAYVLGIVSGAPVNVKQFGCVGDGVTDDTPCFLLVRNFTETSVVTNPSFWSTYIGGPQVLVPAGKYLVKQPQILIRYRTPASSIGGYSLLGDGEGSVIVYNYTPTLWKRSDASLTNVVASSNVCTLNTAAPHNQSAGGCITIANAPDTNIQLNKPYIIQSVPTSTSMTVNCQNVTNGTYTDSTIVAATSCPLIYNNDTWESIRMEKVSFVSNDQYSDFMYSTSTGAPKDFTFTRMSWYSWWNRIFDIDGPTSLTANTNGDFRCDHCRFATLYGDPSDFGPTTEKIQYVLYTNGLANSQYDQFINYVFDSNQFFNHRGKATFYLNAGGSLRVINSDFSGILGTGDAAAPFYHYVLKGTQHFSGVAHFLSQGNRYELPTNSARALYSQWGAYGTVTMRDEDFTSSLAFRPSGYPIIDIDYTDGIGGGGVNNGATYNFENSEFIGGIHINAGLFDDGFRRFITLKNVGLYRNESTGNSPATTDWNDWTNQITFTANTCVRCLSTFGHVWADRVRGRGVWQSISANAWAATTAYSLNDRVRSNGRIYKCTVAGTTSTTPPYGRVNALVDGTATWQTVDLYDSVFYASTANIRPNLAFMPIPATQSQVTVPINTVAVQGHGATSSGNLPRAIAPATLGYALIVLPANTMLSEIKMGIVADANNAAGSVSYSLRTDEYTPTTLGTGTCTFATPQTGGVCTIQTAWFTGDGSDMGKRIIVVETGTTTPNIGYALATYN